MKFSWKILLCTMLIMAAACGASGYFFVNYVILLNKAKVFDRLFRKKN